MPQHGGGAEPAVPGDLLDPELAGSSRRSASAPAARQPCSGVVPVSAAEAAGEGARGLSARRASRPPSAARRGGPAPSPASAEGSRRRVGRRGARRTGPARRRGAAATTIRRATGVGHRGAESLRTHVQAEVDPGRGAGAGQDRAVLDVEDVADRARPAGTAGEPSAWNQWVVARRPSSSPAWASTKAPVQNESTRAPRSAAACSAATSSGRGPGSRCRRRAPRPGRRRPAAQAAGRGQAEPEAGPSCRAAGRRPRTRTGAALRRPVDAEHLARAWRTRTGRRRVHEHGDGAQRGWRGHSCSLVHPWH